MENNSQERLNQAIRLSQQGDKVEARKILLQLIQENQQNEYAWLWLIDVCNSDRERKAILSRGLKVNPQSKLLKTAMRRFIDTGDLRSISDSLDSLIIDTQVEDVVQSPTEQAKAELISEQGSDLDWISLEDDGLHDDGLDTISDEEFSRLSAQYFNAAAEEEPLEEVATLELTEEPESTVDQSDLFLLDEVVEDEEPADAVSESGESSPFIDFDEEEDTGIEDQLKDALVEDTDAPRIRRKLRMPDFKKMSRRILVILVSTFWLVVFVLVGLFVVHYFDLEQYLTLNGRSEEALVEPTATATPEMTATPTQEVVEIVFAPTEIIEESAVVYVPFIADSLGGITPVESVDQIYPVVPGSSGMLNAALVSNQLMIMDNQGKVLWEKVFEADSVPYLGVGFSTDEGMLGLFAEDLHLDLFDMATRSVMTQLAISPAMTETYSSIPYIPGTAQVQVQFSPDDAYVSAAFWGGMSIWNVETGEVVYEYSLTADVLKTGFNNNTNLQFALDWNTDSSQVVYGVNSDIFLLDMTTGTILQNWKTQKVGTLAFSGDDLVIESGYSLLNNQPSYVSVYKVDSENVYFKGTGLNASRGIRLPLHVVLGENEYLVYESEGRDQMVVLKVVSLVTGIEQEQLETGAYEPLWAITTLDEEGLLVVWARFPKASFGAVDQVQFWDLDALELVDTCEKCSYPAAVLADGHSITFNEDFTEMTLIAQGVGIQILKAQE